MKFLNKNIKINVVLILGLLLIFIGVLLLTGYFAKNPQSIFSFRGVILFLLGAFILFIELMNPSKTWLMFISSVLMLISLVIGMIDVGFLPYAVKNIWPCFVIIFGLGLVLFSIYKTKKIKAVYLIPALVIMAFGVFFMFFSIGIIKISFVSIAAKLWPLLFVFCGLALVATYFIQNHNLVKQDKLNNNEDSE
jgi:hypothetical protein